MTVVSEVVYLTCVMWWVVKLYFMRKLLIIWLVIHIKEAAIQTCKHGLGAGFIFYLIGPTETSHHWFGYRLGMPSDKEAFDESMSTQIYLAIWYGVSRSQCVHVPIVPCLYFPFLSHPNLCVGWYNLTCRWVYGLYKLMYRICREHSVYATKHYCISAHVIQIAATIIK